MVSVGLRHLPNFRRMFLKHRTCDQCALAQYRRPVMKKHDSVDVYKQNLIYVSYSQHKYYAYMHTLRHKKPKIEMRIENKNTLYTQ